jgi:hypothetical protein
MQLDTGSRNAELDAVRDQLNGGTPPATWEVRTGSKPTNMTDPDTGTVLASGTLANPPGSNASGGTQSYTINADTSADASGTPGYVVLKQGGTGTAKQRYTAGVGSGEWNFNATIALGGNVSVSSFTLTAGNA